MKIVAFMPAKGTSERIPNKNLSILDGELLFRNKLRQLLSCPLIDEVYIDTDSDTLASLAADLPVKRLHRPPELATNKTDGHELFAWECSQVDADIYVQALCTAPFVSTDTLTRAIKALTDSPDSDSLVAITRGKQYTWSQNEPDYGRGRIPNSVDLPSITREAMSLYIVRRGQAPVQKRFGHKPIFFELTPQEDIDVNWAQDLQLAETISAGIRAQENLMLGSLKPYLSSAMLSDITREMGLSCTLPSNITGTGRFFGRCKTLQLDKVTPGEKWEGIYDALNSYQFIRPGDVIMVDNKVHDRAYFGSLNAQLALRAGAVGAVINGVTRDHDDVKKLGLPVFATGHYCLDIKFDGTVRSMNVPIIIGNVTIANNDYVFADSDGIVVIPQKHWSEVRELTLKGIEKEWRVGMAVALGRPPREILDQIGEF